MLKIFRLSLFQIYLVSILFMTGSSFAQNVFYEDWETGIGSWTVTNGVWEVGIPTVGPTSTHSGVNCVGTILGGIYPPSANTRLISPIVTLPSGHVRLKFWHWYGIGPGDAGVVQVSTDNGVNWVAVSTTDFDGSSTAWTQSCVDLSAYAGTSVRIGFYFTSNWGDGEGVGWYLDDVSIVAGTENFPNPEDFELGYGDWNADNGLWEVGIPTVGPTSTHSGVNCVGTILGGIYPPSANTRLISPIVTLPSGHVRLKFWHWYGIGPGDAGVVQVSTDNGVNWVAVSTTDFDGSSTAWTQSCVDLSAYAGTSVRIGFYFTSNWGDGEGVGWYLDDVSIVAGTENFPNPEDFELGYGDWNADNGLWEVGIPTVGPTSTHSGVNCVGTILGGIYPPSANTRLISPIVTLPSGHVRLKFWHWYGIGPGDAGVVQVSTDNGVNWVAVSTTDFDGSSTAWTQSCVDLSAYAGTSVRIGFYFTSNWGDGEGVGWYLDDVSIVAGTENFPNPEDFELGYGDWNADNGLWEVGIPTVGPTSTHSGVNCVGTILGGVYPPSANTRLISPIVTLQSQLPKLFFWHWYNMGPGDSGKVQISVDDGPWQNFSGFGGPYAGNNSTWSLDSIPLLAFVDSSIRIGFYFTSNYGDPEGTGWYIDDIYISGMPTTFQMSVSVNNGWNMVSVPGLHSVDQNVDTWWQYRDFSANVFKYSGGYQPIFSTTPTEGYWMKHSGVRVYNTGDEWPLINMVTHEPINATTGWNLIGGYENNALTTGLATNPPGLIDGPVYKYAGGYQVATSLEPGQGYWIKLSGAGQIIIPDALVKETEPEEYFKKDWGRIIIADNAGHSYKLYAVGGKNSTNLSAYELPPAPPEGMFDIRFGSGRIAEDINSSIKTIEMSGIVHPLTIRVEGMDIRLMDEGGRMLNVSLKDGEEIIISDGTIQKLMVTGEMIATAYSLEQNYPNPFNPSTVIDFSLPEDVSNVKLSIYNALGEKVAELANTALVAGKYSYQWNAQNVASGMYIYELRTNKFISVKKMVLLK